MGSRKSEVSQRGTANSFWEWFRQLSVFGFLIFSIFHMFLGVPESVFISEQWIWGSETCFFSMRLRSKQERPAKTCSCSNTRKEKKKLVTSGSLLSPLSTCLMAKGLSCQCCTAGSDKTCLARLRKFARNTHKHQDHQDHQAFKHWQNPPDFCLLKLPRCPSSLRRPCSLKDLPLPASSSCALAQAIPESDVGRIWQMGLHSICWLRNSLQLQHLVD